MGEIGFELRWSLDKFPSFMFLFFLSQKKSNKSFFPVAGAEQFLFKEKGFKTLFQKECY